MKTFKDFLEHQIDELNVIKPKAKGEQEFVKQSYLAQVKDPGDLEDVGPEEQGPKSIKTGQGKRIADRLDNKQPFGEQDMKHPEDVKTPANKLQKYGTKKWLTKDVKEETDLEESEYSEYKTGGKPLEKKFEKSMSKMGVKAKVKMRTVNNISVNEEVELTEEEILALDEAEVPFTPDKPKKNPSALAGKYGQGPSTAKHLARQGMQKTLRQMKKSKEMKEEEEVDEKYVNPGLEKLAAKKKTMRQMKEADFSKQQTKMAHTIGKEFEKKGVGDETKGGPYAVASAMVRDKPEAAKKAYKTIQSKMKEETDAEILFKLYDDLNEDNQEIFMEQLETDAEGLLEFAKSLTEE